MQEKISQAVIRRLPRYYRYLSELLEEGIERISSKDLSVRMNVTASQIRQDINNFGEFGLQGYGYNVRDLYQEIKKILGLDQKHYIIVIGAGNMGRAIAKYPNFEKNGFIVTALFDVDPDLIGKAIRGIPIYDIGDLPQYMDRHRVDIAALTIPKDNAKEIVECLVNLNIGAIWNFAYVDLDLPSNIVVENVHLSDSLTQLSYNILNRRNEQG